MRILQLLPELNEGGVERGVVELNRELVKRGQESIVISAGGRQSEQIDKDGGKHIVFDTCSKSPLSAPSRIFELRRLFSKLAPDVLHARSRVPAWLAYLANRPLRIPFVTTVHGFNSVNAYSRVMTFGDRIICVSQAIKDYIQQNYQIAEDKIAVIPRGVDLELFDPERVDLDFMTGFRREYGLDGHFVVTAVGRITQLKDYETFIRGVVAARSRIANIRGLIVGGVRKDKRDYYHSLQKLVSDLNAQEIIDFCGSQNQIAEIYALSDVVAICSKKPESFGRTAAEALAMKVPVVAAGHGGVLDTVREGETGCLFDVGDSQGLMEAVCSCSRLSRAGLRAFVIDRFSLRQMVDATQSVYQQLAQ